MDAEREDHNNTVCISYLISASSVWYLSDSGQDNTECGKTEGTSCMSIRHIFHICCGNGPNVGLSVITNMSVTIDREVLVSKFYFTLDCTKFDW